MSDKHSKTEKPSPKKLRDARKKGELVKSPDLVSATSFLIFSVLLIQLFPCPLLFFLSQVKVLLYKFLLVFFAQLF